ncbi:hypothetical protein RUM44_000643 [Polyplax serrata]|uniref:Uncharacterized protein n=1 Tax=Polyplax serrata TaxID=468196 RepID=A0ABR1B5Z1_POLSC
MTIQSGASNSQCPLQSGQSMNLAKTLQVQDQIIEQLRNDQVALRQALELERNTLKECRISNDRELKALQRENLQITKTSRLQEMRIEELEKELAFAKEALSFERQNLKTLEKEHVVVIKDLKLKSSKEFEKTNKQEMLIDQLKSEIEDLKEALQSERNATNLLIREHNAEVKTLREEVRNKSTEAYRELKERATREREEYREMQQEAERTYNLLEKDFREALSTKDEELKKVKAEAKLIQKELEDQLRASLKQPPAAQVAAPLGNNDVVEMAKFRRLKNEVSVLKEQNRKLLNELQILTEDNKINETTGMDTYIFPCSNSSQGGFSLSKLDDQSKKSLTVVPAKHSEMELTRMASDFSVSKSITKRPTKSTLSMKRDDSFRPYPKSKTEERYEELKRTMHILRKALQ